MKTTKTRPGAAGVAPLAAALAAALISAGCETSSFVPPPPPGGGRPAKSNVAATYDVKAPDAPSPAPAAATSESRQPIGTARVVELILARPANDDRDYLDRALRRELGKARIPFRRVDPGSREPSSPEALAAAIRGAADRRVAGLIVEPLDQPAVIDALYDAVGRGCAVLLLDRSVPPRDGKTIPRVEYTGMAEAGRQLVADVLDAQAKLERSGPARIFVLHHRIDDSNIDRCLESLVEPLRAAGKESQVVAFESDLDRAIAALRKAMGADPRIDILLADDMYGMTAASKLRTEWAEALRPEFLVAGYTPYDFRTPDLIKYARGFADRSIESYAVKTCRAIESLLDGKPVGDVVAVPVTFHRQATLYVPKAEKQSGPEKKASKP